MLNNFLRITFIAVCAGFILSNIGCEDDAEPELMAQTSPEPVARPSAWRELEGSSLAAITDAVPADELARAIAEARAAAEGARLRWLQTPPELRRTWAVQWAAPTIDGGVEYLWVEPHYWSTFRIEGRLASPPQRALRENRSLGESISFPIDEMTDWMHTAEGPTGPVREGGFTITVMEKHLGTPPPPPRNER